ncbi:MATE family efflux transporter [Patescibacteria group bacterium]|nr:MATE family efflux transporter [Patescibacteria group bacterium]MBU1953574.1 MATE family efflux transporter [Patescibacteria group bacterium]
MSRKKLPDFTQGPIVKSLVTLAIPIVFANILQTAYQLVDTFWVGRLGADAVAAVSLSFPIIFLMISMGGGLAIAGTIMVSQYKGQGHLEKVDYVSAQTLFIMFFISVIVTVLGYNIAEPVMKLMGAGPDVLPQAVSYLQISFLGMIFVFGYFVFQSLMRGVGDVKTPLYIVLATVILNLLLDPLFILGWGPIPAYGVMGAAIATVGTQGVATIIGTALLFSGKYGIHIKIKNFRLDFQLMKKMIGLGLPASIEQSTRALGMAIMTFLVASFGTISVAAYGIGGRVLSFIIIPTVGLSMATSTLVGQNIGAGKIDRAEKITRKSSIISFVTLTAIGIVLFIFSSQITAAFIPDDPQVIASSSLFIKIMAFTFGFIGLQQSINGAFRGSGNTMTSMVLSIVSLWVLQFPIAYILSKHTSLGEIGIWWAFPVSNVIATLVALVWFLKGDWKHKKITEPKTAKLTEEIIAETIIEEG